MWQGVAPTLDLMVPEAISKKLEPLKIYLFYITDQNIFCVQTVRGFGAYWFCTVTASSVHGGGPATLAIALHVVYDHKDSNSQ